MSEGDRIRVLIVDDIADTCDNLEKLLYFEKDIEVIGKATMAWMRLHRRKTSSRM